MGWSDFLGNGPVRDLMRQSLSDGRLPSSLLFAGIAGVGKGTLAHFLSKAANCQKLHNDFCDECRSCRKIEQGVHPDVRTYAPEGAFIKIDQMRDLIREVFFKPFEGRRRVFVIDQAHRLRLEAANALLKTLEEPPETSLPILVTDSPNDLPGTLRSRCQRIQFHPFSPAELESILQQRSIYPTRDLPLVGRISGGSLGKALNLDLQQYREARREMLEAIRACTGALSYRQALQITEPLASSRQKGQFEFKTGVLYDLLRDLLLIQQGAPPENLTNLDLHSELAEIGSALTFERIVDAVGSLDHLMKGLGRNLNKSLALDRFLFRLSGTVPT